MTLRDEQPSSSAATSVAPSPETIGHQSATIPVEISTRFLEHFSEFMYSSPQKAFEELISNGWDALADYVDVRIPTDLSAPSATLSVLDNGESMDEDGLRQLWHIAFSQKRNTPEKLGRKIIGQFGIGKLATYVLASKLTYICKASDGKIRRVTMDYDIVDQKKESVGDGRDSLISNLKLDVYEVTEAEVEAALQGVYDGQITLDLIKSGIPRPAGALGDDEFGTPADAFMRPTRDTWTLVILSGLKPTGRELKVGVLRRMLQAALPFRSSMAICINGDLLSSSKVDSPIARQWIIGPELTFTSIDLEESNATDQVEKSTISLKVNNEPYPHVEIPGIGSVTGTITLFENQISGGKSDERGSSNGFHVNVLGRLVNQNDPSFGEENLSHAAWARFRMAIRADGLNNLLTTDREKFKVRRELKIFRAFLRRAFNMARTNYDSDVNAAMPDGGDVLVKSLGVMSLSPLRNVVSETLKGQAPIRDLFDETGIPDRSAKLQSWRDNTSENIKNALSDVKYEASGDEGFVKFRLSDNTIVVNKDHPFVAEHSRTKAEKELLRTIAMVNLLSDVYALDIGIAPVALQEIRDYRDRLLRFRAMQQRRSGTYIAKLLLQMQNDSANSKHLEAVLSDALRYLGFQVQDLAKSGEPEGVASAFSTPSNAVATAENPNPPLYSFTFDAKSSKKEVAATNNINLAGVVEHRERYKANYALVVAPGFSDGALATRCEQQKVTPMMASDLGKLMEYTVAYGAIPVTKLREIFEIYDPTKVSAWVADLQTWIQTKRPLTLDIFLRALESLKGQVPDVLPAGTLAFACRTTLKAASVTADDVIALARGLSILIPDLVGIDNDKIVVNASADRVAAAVATQLEKLHDGGPVEGGDSAEPKSN
ncbi:ATP-binding protein [Salmonella enterica]|nr:ATP-binding protein [Salmonella enterica subsp. enterica serovar Orion]ECS6780561.1 ATP-binding protein [Salmonella enterica subsp. enterica serovar Orion]EDB0984399.1 ATP-binding protein [Salmonella enterica subsp. enterica serovar Orion]EDQ0133397.1 ATP-binding protein [Salmonella enterica subsp. enterica serovar Orion]EDQ9238585.1 ATP-binding protein [Salmonella enterica subsp. enterica serovar Orion]